MAYVCEKCRLYRKESFVCPRCGMEAKLSYHRGNDLLQFGYEESREDDVPATEKPGRVSSASRSRSLCSYCWSADAFCFF